MSARTPAAAPDTTYAPPATPRINRLAIWSVVLSVITLGGPGSLAGIILGARAHRRISQTGERGNGLAIAGITIGVLTLILVIGYWIFLALHSGSYGGGGHGGGGGGY